MSSLFRLPLEVRQMIYGRCLVVGKVFPYTHAERYDEYECDYDDEETGLELSGCEEPWVPLLRVSRAVHEEAEPMLYQRNTFVLPACDLTIRFFKRSLHNDLRKAWVKSIVLALDASDMTSYDRGIVLDKHLDLIRDEMLFPERAYYDASWPEEESFKEHLHLAYNDRLGDVIWPRKASYVLKNLSLNNVIFDFRGSTCIEGCCDMQSKALRSIEKGFAMGRPIKVEVLGGRWWTPDFHVSSPLLVPLIVHKTAFAILAEPSLTKATASIRETNLAVETCCSCALLLSLLNIGPSSSIK